MPHPELDLIRQRYSYACGYCGITEVSTGGMLTLDHYRPLSAGGDDSLDNLVYACVRCNQYKHTYWPTDDELARGLHVLHPLYDILSTHYRLDLESGLLEPLSETGRFHITLLRLNRPQLVKYRLALQIREAFESRLNLLERQILELHQTIRLQEHYIAALQDQLGKAEQP
jgi:hypothetical protein